MVKTKVALIWTFGIIAQVCGHAIFWEPPSRASLGKQNLNFCNVAVNDDHNGVFCGGRDVQISHEGRCGVCGDEFGASYRPHEAPGKYASGIIVRSYTPGEVIEAFVDIVANHRGFVAFALCENNDPLKDKTQECFNKNKLKTVDGLDFVKVPLVNGRVVVRLQLPQNLTCWQCILQFNYVTGNSWGIGPQNSDFSTPDCINDSFGKLGCGSQEMFRNCADICIGEKCPKKTCEVAKPFEENFIEETTLPPLPINEVEELPQKPTVEIGDRICTETKILKSYASLLGQSYCEFTCLNQKMDYCNLIICSCITE